MKTPLALSSEKFHFFLLPELKKKPNRRHSVCFINARVRKEQWQPYSLCFSSNPVRAASLTVSEENAPKWPSKDLKYKRRDEMIAGTLLRISQRSSELLWSVSMIPVGALLTVLPFSQCFLFAHRTHPIPNWIGWFGYPLRNYYLV